MRTTLFSQQLRIAVLIVAFCAPAMAVRSGSQAQKAVARPESPTVAQSLTAVAPPGIAGTTSQTMPSDPTTPTEILRAGILPDPANLLPVAAVVGFSLLFGGIVSAFKTKP